MPSLPHEPKCRVETYLGIWLMDFATLDPMVQQARGIDVLEAQRRYEDRKLKIRQQEEQDTKDGKPVRRYRLEDGIAIVNIEGPTTKYETKMSDVFGLSSTLMIDKTIRDAVKDPSVKGIMMYVDSPGGMLDGSTELVDTIRWANKQKPVTAHFADRGTSAALLYGSQARRVTANRTASIGSIGTKATLINRTKELEAKGLEAIELKAGKFKGAGDPFLPVDKETKKYLQERIESVNESFINDVAWSRNLDPAKIRAMEARVYVAPEAIKMGLIDDVCSFEDALQYAKTNNVTEPTRGKLVTFSKPAVTPGAPAPRSVSMLDPTTQAHVRTLPGAATLQEDQLEGFFLQYNKDLQTQITVAQQRQGGQVTPPAPTPAQVAVVPTASDKALIPLCKAAKAEVEMLEMKGCISPAQKDHFLLQLEPTPGHPNPLMFAEQGGKYAYETLLETLQMNKSAAKGELPGQATSPPQPGAQRVHDPKKDANKKDEQATMKDIVGKALTASVASSYSPARQAERFDHSKGVALPTLLQQES